MVTQLRFINLSWSVPVPDVLLYQLNQASQRRPLVWRRIRSCAYGWSHDIRFSQQLSLAFRYSDSCWTPSLAVAPGAGYQVARQPGAGVSITPLPGQHHQGIIARNSGSRGQVDAFVLRDGLPLAWEPLLPGQEASFAFDPVLILGTEELVEPGQTVPESPAERFHTSINLHGITRANLLMTGGGHGPDAEPLRFQLDKVCQA